MSLNLGCKISVTLLPLTTLGCPLPCVPWISLQGSGGGWLSPEPSPEAQPVFSPGIIPCSSLIKLFCPHPQSSVGKWFLCFLCLEMTSCLIHKTPPSLKNPFLKKSCYYASNFSLSIRKKISPCYHNKTLKIRLPLNFPKWPCTKHAGLADERNINLLTLRHSSCAFPNWKC